MLPMHMKASQRDLCKGHTDCQKHTTGQHILRVSDSMAGEASPQVIAHGKCLAEGDALRLGRLAIIVVPGGPGHCCVSRCAQELQELIYCLQA